MIKVAFGSVPKDGGTFTFYRNQAPPLLEYGVEMFCVSTGRDQASLWEDAYADDHCILLAENTNSIEKQSRAFVDWCIRENIAIVIGVNSQAILSAIPHLPKQMKAVARAANAFDHGYRITLSGGDRLAKIIALVPRLRLELIENYGADPQLFELIPNGIDPKPYVQSQGKERGYGSVLQLGFIGRLEHSQKGVFYLPDIASELDERGVNYHLTIAGKGKHGKELRKRLSAQIHAGKVTFVGSLPPKEVVSFFRDIDVQLFVSHFEGCPNALLEGMMAGCVPVVYNISGITDFLIKQGETGFHSPMANYKDLVNRIQYLNDDRNKLRKMSKAGSEASLLRFTNEIAAKSYADLFRSVVDNGLTHNPLPWSAFIPDPNFEKSKWDFIPIRWRNRLKAFISR